MLKPLQIAHPGRWSLRRRQECRRLQAPRSTPDRNLCGSPWCLQRSPQGSFVGPVGPLTIKTTLRGDAANGEFALHGDLRCSDLVNTGGLQCQCGKLFYMEEILALEMRITLTAAC